MSFYGNLVCAVMVAAIAFGAYVGGYKNGRNAVQVEWDKAVFAANELAEQQRKQEQEKARRLSSRYEAALSTQRQTSKAISEQLDAALKSKPFPLECRLDGVQLSTVNASLAGKSNAGAELPASGITSPAAKDGANGGSR